MRTPWLAGAVCLAYVGSCADAGPAGERPAEPTWRARSALTPADPVSKAVTDTCSTASVRGLSDQRTHLQAQSFKWLGANDPPHYDYTGAGTAPLRGLSVLAFQRLWNRNHPEDRIAEDGAYGTQTERRLASSPSGGFTVGARCDDAGALPDLPPEAPAEPDGQEPEEDATAPPRASMPRSDEGGGCSVAGRRSRDREL
jgi:hypothetical protein